jgi:hypothetical protein
MAEITHGGPQNSLPADMKAAASISREDSPKFFWQLFHGGLIR